MYLHHSPETIAGQLWQPLLKKPGNLWGAFWIHLVQSLLYRFFITIPKQKIQGKTRLEEAAPHATTEER